MFAGNSNPHSHGSQFSSVQPIPQEMSCHVANHIQVIFSAFPEQSKASVLHMTSLFHAFILCQVCYQIMIYNLKIILSLTLIHKL